MSDDKPLHVQVAEALGWTELEYGGWVEEIGGQIYQDHRRWRGYGPYQVKEACGNYIPMRQDLPHYDTDWAWTGALIERLGISLNNYSQAPTKGTTAHRMVDDRIFDASAETQLLAVCNLILKLKEAGKL